MDTGGEEGPGCGGVLGDAASLGWSSWRHGILVRKVRILGGGVRTLPFWGTLKLHKKGKKRHVCPQMHPILVLNSYLDPLSEILDLSLKTIQSMDT